VSPIRYQALDMLVIVPQLLQRLYLFLEATHVPVDVERHEQDKEPREGQPPVAHAGVGCILRKNAVVVVCEVCACVCVCVCVCV
jgi:hypothetical protein